MIRYIINNKVKNKYILSFFIFCITMYICKIGNSYLVENLYIQNIITNVLFQIISSLIVISLIKLIEKRNLSDIGLTFKHIGHEIKLGLLIFLIPMFFTIIQYSIEKSTSIFSYSSLTWESLLFEGIYLLIFIAFVEEFLFRGFLFENLKVIFNSNIISILISSLAFGFIHYHQGGISKVIITSIIGILFCTCKIKLGKCGIISLTIAHWLIDFSLVFMGFLITNYI